MIFVALVQFSVSILILLWVLKKKTGEPYSKKATAKFVLFGALSVIVCLALTLVLSLERDTFFGMNPILSGFLTALLTAALLEEVGKYIFFRLAIWKNREVVSWLDVIIAAVAVAVGFVILEDIEFVVSGSGSIVRAFIPGHILFQAIMGYYYGKARVTKKPKYDVLSLVVPVLCHTAFDMFLIGLMSIVGDVNAMMGLSEVEIAALPYYDYMIPMLVCAIVILVATLVALILMLRKISVWSKNGEKQELLTEETV